MMEKLKFEGTPGPWHVSNNYKKQVCADINLPIANVHSLLAPAEIKANARLIAASPEMLEALLLFVEMDGKDYEMNEGAELVRGWDRLRDKVNKAIKKALEE